MTLVLSRNQLVTREHTTDGTLVLVLVGDLPGGGDAHLLGGLPGLGSHGLHCPHHVHPVNNLTEDHVLAVQPGGLYIRERERVRVRVRVR